MLGYQLYKLGITSTTTLDEKTTKTIAGINLPTLTSENKSAVGTDLYRIAQRIIGMTTNSFVTAKLVTEQEVYSGA